MAALDAKLDELYQLPLAEFTSARNALAKTLSGDEARRVKRLAKPTVVPWAVNQLYWRARPVYDRLLKSGRALREAQIAALEGKKIDVRRANEAHRKALADAVDRAQKLAATEGSHPDVEPLSRMFEALSLAAEPPAQPGRFTELVQPAGFEALTGVTVTAPRRTKTNVVVTEPAEAKRRRASHAEAERRRDEEARRREEAAQALAQATIQAAERELERARATEARARRDLERAEQAVRAAELSLANLHRL